MTGDGPGGADHEGPACGMPAAVPALAALVTAVVVLAVAVAARVLG